MNSPTPRTEAAIIRVLDTEATRNAGSQVQAIYRRYVAPDFARTLERELSAAQALLYRMGRHMRNADNVPPMEWILRGVSMQDELRELDPGRYDREFKGATEPKT